MEAAVTESQVQLAAPLGVIEKTRVVAAVAMAAALLYTVGWMVIRPTDPDLAVTFVRSGRAVAAIWPALAVLTVVAGVFGTVLAGPRLPEAGLFAAANGVPDLSLRGGSMEVLLASEGATDQATRQVFLKAMALDCVLWSLIMLAAWIAVTWAYRWVWLGGAGLEVNAAEEPAKPQAAKDTKPSTPTAEGGASSVGLGWPALVVTGVVGIFVIWMTVGRTPVSIIRRGQTIAAVAGGLYLGAMAARYFTGTRDVRWYLLAVPLVGLLAYLVGYLSANMSWAQGTEYQYYVALATTPTHDLVRPLPIGYIAVGTAGVLAGFWGGEKMEQVAQEVT